MTKWIMGIVLSLSILTSLFAQRPVPGFTNKSIIADNFTLAKKFDVADMDFDGDLDVIAASSNSNGVNVAWFENDGTMAFTQHNVDAGFEGARVAVAADFNNGNSFLEIAAGTALDPQSRFYEYNGSSWTYQNVGINPGPLNYTIRVVDANLDNFPDLLIMYGDPQNKIVLMHGYGDGSFDNPVTLVSDFKNAVDANIADIDQDGDQDLIGVAFQEGTTSFYNIAWWERTAIGLEQREIDNISGRFNSLDLADLDDDGDLDLVVAVWDGNEGARIGWYQNEGNGNFGSFNEIYTGFTNARKAVASDIDGDGDLDIVGAADHDNKVVWLENNNLGFNDHIITSSFSFAYYTLPWDIDGDGDLDILASAQDSAQIAWWENEQNEVQTITAGDAASQLFWNDNVEIDFSQSDQSGDVSVYYNAGKVPNPDSLGAGIDHLALNGYYTITTAKTNYDGSIDFYYGAGNVAEWSNIDNESELVILVWNEEADVWEEAGTAATNNQIINEDYDYITVNGFDDQFIPFSKWTLGSRSQDNSLPVDLIAFTADIVPQGVELNWTTASEVNNLGYEIWRADAADSQYILISDYNHNANLIGAGNSNEEHHYTFIDQSLPGEGSYYYQLVDVDYSNQKNIHGPLQVYYSPAALAQDFRLGQNYPNPFNGITHIPLRLPHSQTADQQAVSLIIYNSLGQVVKTFDLSHLAAGEQKLMWDGLDDNGRAVASGLYFYKLNGGHASQSRRMIYLK
ncbi:MAG: FG-GAP-like repeat-containing protein [Calditrichia bacterium]